jgi:hypothetical protein
MLDYFLAALYPRGVRMKLITCRGPKRNVPCMRARKPLSIDTTKPPPKSFATICAIGCAIPAGKVAPLGKLRSVNRNGASWHAVLRVKGESGRKRSVGSHLLSGRQRCGAK